MRPKVSFVILKGARRNIPHDEPLGQSETKTITLRIHSIQVIPSGLLMSYRISLSEGVASVVSSRQRSECGVLVIWTPVLWCTALQAGYTVFYFADCLIIVTLSAKLDYYQSHHQYPACALVPGGHYHE